MDEIKFSVTHKDYDPWQDWLAELVEVYEAAYRLIYQGGTATALKEALDRIDLEE